MSNLMNHAKAELERAGLFDKGNDYDGMMGEAVLKMIETFAEEGHSGFSAQMAIGLFEKLARFEPISPLTGTDDEWTEVGPGVFQNKRCSHVFKENGQAYDIEGRIFKPKNSGAYTSFESRVPVTFPYTPKREYVEVDE